MGGRNRGFQKQRNGWNQSPRRGQRFGSPSLRNDVTHNTGLTLQEEARQTSSHHEWNSTVQLRKRPVVFVSSGSHDPLQPPTPQPDVEKDASSTVGAEEEAAPLRESTPVEMASIEEKFKEATSQGTKPVGASPEGTNSVGAPFEETKPVGATPEETIPVGAPFEKTEPVEVTSKLSKSTDLTDEQTQLRETKKGDVSDGETTPEQTELQATTPEEEILEKGAPGETGPGETAPEDPFTEEKTNHPDTDNTGSSDEIIVFKGRGAMKAKTQAPSISLTSIQTEIRAVEKEISVASKEPPKEIPVRPAKDDNDGSDDLLRPRRKRGGKRQGRRDGGKDSEEDAMLADYIANMRENGEMFDGLEDDDDDEGSSEDVEDVPSATLGPTTVDGADESTDDETDDGSAVDVSEWPGMYDGLLDVSPPGELEDDDILEEHNAFDVMDWERPSVRRKKGKGGRLPFPTDDLDSDIEETLRVAYNNDRHKKAERKREREELRAMGLLGKRGQVDLRAKYSTGITMSQVIDEVKSFLAGSQETLSLPPMDPHTRKGVHELSHKLNIKSKSIGGGDQRRPVLYRTKKTSYNEQEFDQMAFRIRRRFGRQPPQNADSRKNRQKQKGPKGPKGSRPAARAGGAFDYHDGEVIGASAPELGTENRGRAMMEKMGWSTGTPLGSEENQGILHPVSQTMKKTRAGLGQE